MGLWEKTYKFGGAHFVEKSTIGSNRTGFWSWKLRIFIEQTKVFKAHAVPHGLCANLINALKLLANQQEDGDGLLQNIVTNLGKESRKALTDGLREFIKVDMSAPWMLERYAEARDHGRGLGCDSQGEP